MPGPLRLEYPGAVYHVTCRTNRGEPVFGEAAAADHFLTELGAACARAGWRVHAWTVLPDHAHLVIETPLPNLVSGMKWWLGTFTNRYNRRRGQSGHLFAGRYRAVLVAPEGPYFLEACLHVLLNPARAGQVSPGQRLAAHPATSARWCLRPVDERPPWFVAERLLAVAGLPVHATEAGPAFADWLESRRGAPEPDLWRALRRGWCFGDEAFRAEVLARWREAAPDHRRGPLPSEAQVRVGRQIVAEELARRGWSVAELARRRKTDPEKVAIARRLRRETTLSLRWIAAALHLGSINTLRNSLVAAERAAAALPATSRVRSEQPTRRAAPPPVPAVPAADAGTENPEPPVADDFNVAWD